MADNFYGLSKSQMGAMTLAQIREYYRQNLRPEIVERMPEEDREKLNAIFSDEQGAQDYKPFTPVVNEQHPDLTDQLRSSIKQFGSLEGSAAKLNELGFQTDVDSGELLLKKPDEKEWRKVDPSGFKGPGEFFKDIGDISYDLLAGAVETGATAGAGTLAAPTGPFALPIASLAGGAAAAGLETGRQKIGQEQGVRLGYDVPQIATSGFFGLASPLAFGTAAQTAKQIARRGLTGQAAEKFAQSQRGLIGRAVKATRPHRDMIATGLSGVDEDVIAAAREPGMLSKFTALANMTDAEVRALGKQQKKVAKDGLDAYRRALGKQVAESTKAAKDEGVLIDISDVKQPFVDYFQDLLKLGEQSQYASTSEYKTALKTAENAYKKIFGDTPNLVSPEVAQRLKRNLAKQSGIYTSKDFKRTVAPQKGVAAQELGVTLSKAHSNLNTQLRDRIGDNYVIANDELSYIAQELEPELSRILGKKPSSSIASLNAPKAHNERAIVQEVDDLTGSNIMDTAFAMRGAGQLGKPGLLARSRGGTTSTSSTGLAGDIGTAGGYALITRMSSGEGTGFIGGLLGRAAGTMTLGPYGQKKLLQAGNLGRGAGAYFRDQGILSTPHMLTNTWMQLENRRDNP